MPDYSKSVIYKIQHLNDDNLLYIGSTTNFTKRKTKHKRDCKTSKAKVYVMIRENGGWDCFNMIVIKEFPCENKIELQIEEDNMMREMKSTLNMNRAYLRDEERQEANIKKQKKYRATHQEQISKKSKEYNEKHKEQIKQQKKEYYIKKKQEVEIFQSQEILTMIL